MFRGARGRISWFGFEERLPEAFFGENRGVADVRPVARAAWTAGEGNFAKGGLSAGGPGCGRGAPVDGQDDADGGHGGARGAGGRGAARSGAGVLARAASGPGGVADAVVVRRIDETRMRTGDLEAENWDRFAKGAGWLRGRPLYVVDTAALTPSAIRARARRVSLEAGA